MSNPPSTAKIAGHPLHPMLVPFPIAGFVGALVCDLVGTTDPFWFRASEYLLAAGVVMALLAAAMGLTDFLGDARIPALSIAWAPFLGNRIVVLIEAVSRYRRYSSGAADSTGTTLSVAAVLLMLITGWLGWEMVYRHRVAIADEVLRTDLACVRLAFASFPCMASNCALSSRTVFDLVRATSG